jgi:hypothetical protein
MPIDPTPHMRNLSLFRCTLRTGRYIVDTPQQNINGGIKGPSIQRLVLLADYPNVVPSLELPIITNTS